MALGLALWLALVVGRAAAEAAEAARRRVVVVVGKCMAAFDEERVWDRPAVRIVCYLGLESGMGIVVSFVLG